MLFISTGAFATPETKHDHFKTPASTGTVNVDVGFEPDLIAFKITSTNPSFNRTESYLNNKNAEDFGWGHGFADCSSGTCNEVAQSDGSGSDSTNGYAAGSTDKYSIYQVVTDNSGNKFVGSINGSVTSTDSSGFTVDFDAVHEQQNVVYTAYKFSNSADIEIGSFRTPSSEGTQQVDTGFKPNFIQTVTTPEINEMNQFIETGGNGPDYGWSLGWAAERNGNIDQATMGTTLYAKDPDSHVASANNSEIIHTLWKEDTGPINGRLQAELNDFNQNGFELDYTNINPDTSEGNRFLVTYAAVKSSANPEVGITTNPTNTGTQLVDTDVKLGSVNFIGSNTIPSVSSEMYSGNNNGDNHWGWMFGGGNSTRSSQVSMGFSSHSNSVNGHSSGSFNNSAFRLLFTDMDGNILGEDAAHINKINKTGFVLDWTSIATTSTSSNIRYDNITYAYHGFSKEPEKTLEYVKTYKDGKPRSFVANNTNLTIEAKGDFQNAPEITLIDSKGTVRIQNVDMTSTEDNYQYNYTLNGSQGWYDVKVNDELVENKFYQGEVWQDNYTDAAGDQFTFRKEIELQEPGTSDRWFEPINEDISFSFDPLPESVRLVAWNGSRNLEVPVQLHNKNTSSDNLKNAKTVFFSSIEKSETRKYYLVSGNQAGKKTYEDILKSKNDSEYYIENDGYRKDFDTSSGGLTSDIISRIGTNDSLVENKPVDRYPEFSVGINTITPRKTNSVDFSIVDGSLYTEFTFEGNASEDGSKPYELSCKAYGKSPYMICEKNQSTETSESVSNFFFNGLFFRDDEMNNFAYLNSSNLNETEKIEAGDNSNIQGLDDQMKWVSFYNNETGDGVADIFLERDFNKTDQPEFEMQDNSENDFYRSKIIDSASIESDAYFYSKTARMIFNGVRGSKFVNETYQRLENPVTVQQNQENTRDLDQPNYTASGNVSSDDSSDVKTFTKWVDDSLLDYAEINITGNGVNGSKTGLYYNDSYEIRDQNGFVNSSWVNVTLSGDEINAGEITANYTVYDIAGKSNTTEFSFNVSDTTPPEFGEVNVSPITEDLLDPGVQINFSVNITDYSNVSGANLSYRSYNTSSNSWNSYNKLQMNRTGGQNFRNTYEANFTPEKESTYSYYINATDENNLNSQTDSENLSVFNDSTWDIDSNLEDVTGSYDTNLTAGNVTVTNTGDYATSLTLDSDFSERTWINGTETPYETSTLQPDSFTFLELNATTRESSESEGVDNITLTVSNSSLDPGQRNRSFILTTSTGGPFLDPSIERFDPEVTRGDTGIEIETEVVNRGNETADNVVVNLDIPGGWSGSGANTTSSNSTSLSPDSTKVFQTYLDVGEDAETGNVNIVAYANSTNTENRSDTVTINVEEQDTSDDSSSSSSGGGSSGGSSGGLGGISLPDSEVETRNFEIETSSELTLIRGKDNSFKFVITNPFDSRLENIEVIASGFLSPHIELVPANIGSIPANSSKELEVKLTAPEYLTVGVHSLNFSITGVKNTTEVRESGNYTFRSGSVTRLNATKQFRIRVHEFSRENASKYLNRSKEILQKMEKKGVASRELRQKVETSEADFNSNSYGPTRETYQELSNQWNRYQETSKEIDELKQQIESAEKKGIKVDQSSRLVKLADQALERGDITGAATRASEARNIFQLQTKGAFNPVYFVRANFYKLLSLTILGLILAAVGYFRIKYSWVKRKINRLEAREKAIKEDVRKVQKESLSGGSMSIQSYENRMMKQEEELEEIVEKRIKWESEKSALLKLGRGKQRLENEREKLIEMMEQAQQNYYEEENISKRIYDTKIENLYERLSEVESDLSEKIVREESGGAKIWTQIR